MSLATLEAVVLKLTESERTKLAAVLLHSLPASSVVEGDDGIEEAMRRKEELDANPSIGMTLEEYNAFLDR